MTGPLWPRCPSALLHMCAPRGEADPWSRDIDTHWNKVLSVPPPKKMTTTEKGLFNFGNEIDLLEMYVKDLATGRMLYSHRVCVPA